MGSPSTNAKARWNKEHYKQLKIYVLPQTADLFKSACVNAGVSMSGEIIGFMETRIGKAHLNKSAKSAPDPFATRGKRRVALAALISKLEKLMDAEENYKDRIPENLQGSYIYENAEAAVEQLGEALSILEQVY